MSTFQKLQDKSSQNAFDKKVLSAIQHLHPFVKHRLYIAESTGIIPKNMYHSNGIIDDAIAELYEHGYDVDDDAFVIRLHLFEIVDNRLDELFVKEAFHKNTVSTAPILEEELDSLEEVFTVDADNDYVMEEDLEDISYNQDRDHRHLFVYDDRDSTILKDLEIEDVSAHDSKKLLGKFYSWVPFRASNILDLYIFGKLSFEEIAQIKKIEVVRVERVLNEIKKGFRSHLE